MARHKLPKRHKDLYTKAEKLENTISNLRFHISEIYSRLNTSVYIFNQLVDQVMPEDRREVHHLKVVKEGKGFKVV